MIFLIKLSYVMKFKNLFSITINKYNTNTLGLRKKIEKKVELLEDSF